MKEANIHYVYSITHPEARFKGWVNMVAVPNDGRWSRRSRKGSSNDCLNLSAPLIIACRSEISKLQLPSRQRLLPALPLLEGKDGAPALIWRCKMYWSNTTKTSWIVFLTTQFELMQSLFWTGSKQEEAFKGQVARAVTLVLSSVVSRCYVGWESHAFPSNNCTGWINCVQDALSSTQTKQKPKTLLNKSTILTSNILL